ncbi:hypothetical protein [Polyangium fumosum]|uniref:hypothetical protein n=1 Tax=Polyangium fumosum TaxID=889272 RepID=UPI00147834AA|nr:hypothetical protein [Polyangium fumosum]
MHADGGHRRRGRGRLDLQRWHGRERCHNGLQRKQRKLQQRQQFQFQQRKLRQRGERRR